MVLTETVSQAQKHIIKVTEHPTIPCSRVYKDVFDTIIVECQHPEHNQIKSSDKNNRTGWREPTPNLIEPDTTATTITPGEVNHDRRLS